MEIIFNKQGICRIARYDFRSYTRFSPKLSGLSGIYIPIGNYNRGLYVGQAKNIEERLDRHDENEDQDWLENGYACHLAILDTGDKDVDYRKKVEEEVAKIVKPPFGKRWG